MIFHRLLLTLECLIVATVLFWNSFSHANLCTEELNQLVSPITAEYIKRLSFLVKEKHFLGADELKKIAGSAEPVMPGLESSSLMKTATISHKKAFDKILRKKSQLEWQVVREEAGRLLFEIENQEKRKSETRESTKSITYPILKNVLNTKAQSASLHVAKNAEGRLYGIFDFNLFSFKVIDLDSGEALFQFERQAIGTVTFSHFAQSFTDPQSGKLMAVMTGNDASKGPLYVVSMESGELRHEINLATSQIYVSPLLVHASTEKIVAFLPTFDGVALVDLVEGAVLYEKKLDLATDEPSDPVLLETSEGPMAVFTNKREALFVFDILKGEEKRVIGVPRIKREQVFRNDLRTLSSPALFKKDGEDWVVVGGLNRTYLVNLSKDQPLVEIVTPGYCIKQAPIVFERNGVKHTAVLGEEAIYVINLESGLLENRISTGPLKTFRLFYESSGTPLLVAGGTSIQIFDPITGMRRGVLDLRIPQTPNGPQDFKLADQVLERNGSLYVLAPTSEGIFEIQIYGPPLAASGGAP